MVRKNYRMRKTISTKRFISELGEDFSEHMKEKLLELEIRCVLTRKDDNYILDLKHVEHTKYDFASDNGSKSKKEYCYGQFIVNEGMLYYSEKCIENSTIIKSPIVDTIYYSLSSTDMISYNEINAKKVDDSNIDYVVNTILEACPPVSERYIKIVRGMVYRAKKARR